MYEMKRAYLCQVSDTGSPEPLILLAIVLFALLRFTASDYPFGIFKLLLIYTLDSN
jgi:hypothetical protein